MSLTETAKVVKRLLVNSAEWLDRLDQEDLKVMLLGVAQAVERGDSLEDIEGLLHEWEESSFAPVSPPRLLQELGPSKRYYFVGLTATGNRTAGNAMGLLGYSWMHYPRSIGDQCLFQVLTDTSVAMWFRQGRLPNDGVYILTTRELESWLDACETWYESKPITALTEFEKEVRMFLFKGLDFDRDRFTQVYLEHLEACRSMAKEMGVILHEWNVVADPSWQFLKELTGRSTDRPFPYRPGGGVRTWDGPSSIE